MKKINDAGICVGHVIESGAGRIVAMGYLGEDFDAPLSITIEGDFPLDELEALGIDDSLKTNLVHLNRYVKQFGKVMRSDRLDGCA